MNESDVARQGQISANVAKLNRSGALVPDAPTMGMIKNIKSAMRMREVLLPAASAVTPGEMRAKLLTAKQVGESIWPLGTRKLILQGGAKDKAIGSAAVPAAALILLDAGDFAGAKSLVWHTLSELENLYS